MKALGAVAFLTLVILAVIWITAGVVAALVALSIWLLTGVAVAVLHHLACRAGLNYEERHR